jgi:hypothetical protein
LSKQALSMELKSMSMDNDYKSPPHKLVKFFKRSRDQWKEKALEAKNKKKLCQNRIKFLETSKASLKSEVKSLRAELEKVKMRNFKERVEDTKKKQ